MTLSEGQKRAILDAENAAESCVKRASQCAALNLMTLARIWDSFGKDLLLNVERQKRVFEEDCDDLSKAAN